MNTPLEEQLRDYFTLVDRMQGAVDLDDTADAGSAPTLRLVDTGDSDNEPENHDEPENHHEPENNNEMEEIMLAPNKTQKAPRSRTWLVVAAPAAVVAIVVAGLVDATRDDQQDPIPADNPVPTEPVVEPEVGAGAQPEELTTSVDMRVQPGTYVTDRLGMPLTFTTDSVMRLYFDQTGQILLSGLDSSTGEIAGMRLTRLGGWHTGEEAAIPVAEKPASIDPYDIDAWIADNDVIAERRPDATIDDHTATVYDVRIDPASDLQVGCNSSEAPCFYSNRVSVESDDPTQMADFNRTIFQGLASRMWLVEVPGFDPILIEAVAGFHPKANLANANAFDGDAVWLDEFETTILPTVRVGPDGPPLPFGS
ncbi:MAG: hypothetical protein QNM02_09045 [Acidimicrobiia bacterium]|nr:hypothetical protein [Acidimicrobiia bacterium]